MRKLIHTIKIATIVVLSLLGILNLSIYIYNLFSSENIPTATNTQFLVMGLIYLGGAFAISRFRLR